LRDVGEGSAENDNAPFSQRNLSYVRLVASLSW
jgi:hypothetical protein